MYSPQEKWKSKAEWSLFRESLEATTLFVNVPGPVLAFFVLLNATVPFIGKLRYITRSGFYCLRSWNSIQWSILNSVITNVGWFPL